MKSKTHQLIITVLFDKKCTKQLALREVRDSIYGEFYTTPSSDDSPDTFRVKSIRIVRGPEIVGKLKGH